MGLKFLQDIVNLDNIQFVNSSGTNAGLINMDGNDLVISNSQGDVLLGDGSADVFIGDGTNNVDIRFEQSGSITADNASATLTIGGTGNLVVEEPTINNPTFSGAFNLGSKLTLSTSNGYILFDYEPAGDTGEYTTEVPLLKVDHNGVEKTILSRISENGGIQLGHDDSVLITAGDVGDEIKSNWGATNENVVLASEAGFYALAFPNNSTTWSNRNIFRFYGGDATAANNGLYIGDGSSTQFIDLDRNLKNIGTITTGGDVTIGPKSNATVSVSESGGADVKMRAGSVGRIGTYSNHDFIITQNSVDAITIDTSRNATFAADVKADTHFTSSDTNVTLSTSSNGTVFLRPNGKSSTTSQSTFTNALASIGTDATFTGDVTVNGGDLTVTSASTNSVINLNGGDSFVEKDSGTDLYIANNVSDRDIKFRVKDNGTNVIALTLDGSENGNATFTGSVTATTLYGNHPDGNGSSLKLGRADNSNYWFFNHAGNDLRIYNTASSGSDILLGVDPSGSAEANNVGIGTATPGNKLEVNSGTTNVAAVFQSSDNQAWISVQDDDSGTYGALFGTDSDEGHDIVLADRSANKRLVIDTSGNVGIGHSSPSANLHLYENNTATDATAGLTIEQAGTGDAIAQFLLTGVRRWVVGADNSDADKFKIASSIDLASDAHLTIGTSGNVGIGTTSPSEKLDVAGNAIINGDLTVSGTAPTLRIQDSRNLNNPDWDSVSLGNIEFYTSDTTSPGARVLAEIEAFSNNAAASGPNADLIFKTSAIADSSPQTRLTIGYEGTATFTGNIVVSGTVDGRDVATDGTKLDTIATNADVTPSWVPSSDPSYLTEHPNISAASSVNNSGKTHIQDITVDSNGHVTGIVSHTLNSSDFVEPNSNATLNSLSCGTFTHPTDISFVLDNDNNETASFTIKDGAGNSPFTLTEAGDLTITGKFVSTYAAKGSSGDILVEDSGEIKKRTPAELKTDLSLNNVPNTDATNASNLASGTVPTARLATTAIAKGGTGATTASGARAALGVDAAGTDNSTDVTLAGSLNYITISGQEITRNAIDLAADVTGTLPQTNLPDDMDSDKVKQICTTHHNFFMNSTANPPTADFFVPFNNLNESSNPTNAQYYNRMVAPYDGRIVKVVLHTTAAIGTACQVLFWVATSAGVFAPSAAETVTGVNLNTANTSATATFSTTSTAQFSAGDVLGVSIIKSTTATANMQVTVVWEYTL